MRLTKEHRIQIPASRYFELMFDPEFEKRMSQESMHTQAWELLERSVDGPAWNMRCRITPADNMPGFIKKLIGGGFSFEEKRTHQKGSDSAASEMIPSVMRDKLRMGYKLRLIPDGEEACRRVIDWDIEVKIFGIGGQVEKFIASEVERGTDATARYLNQHAAKPAA